MPIPSAPITASEQLLAQCDRHLQTLRRSAMFALSRGAKELFHTNFLAFILEINEEAIDQADRDVVREIRKALLERIFVQESPARVMAWREPRSLDLVLAASPEFNAEGNPQLGQQAVLKQGRKSSNASVTPNQPPCLVVIEAKLKALPDVEQLHRYTQVLDKGLALTLDPEVVPANNPESATWGRLDIKMSEAGAGVALLKAYPPKLLEDKDNEHAKQRRCIATGYGNVRRLLLAPSDPFNAAGQAKWDFLPWSELLKDFQPSITECGGTVTAMLRDYKNSTGALLEVLQEVTYFVDQGYVAAKNNLSLGDVNAVAARFQSLRIHDIVGKTAYSVLLGALNESLDDSLNQQVGPWRRAVEVFMTRGTPGFCIAYQLTAYSKHGRRQVSLGVQVQGKSFRRYVSASHPSEAREASSLNSLVELIRNLATAEGKWWAVDSDVDLPLNKFGAEAFLYVGVDAKSWTFLELKTRLAESMELAAKLVGNTTLNDAARNLLSSRQSGT